MNKFGATFYPKRKYKFPLRLISSRIPLPINYLSGSSAQLKSAVILAGLNSFGNTEIVELKKSRDHTEKMLLQNSQAIKVLRKKNNIIQIFGKKYLKSLDIKVPGDPSSSAFFSAMTLLNKNSYFEYEFKFKLIINLNSKFKLKLK